MGSSGNPGSNNTQPCVSPPIGATPQAGVPSVGSTTSGPVAQPRPPVTAASDIGPMTQRPGAPMPNGAVDCVVR
jgi:hypothetical protein